MSTHADDLSEFEDVGFVDEVAGWLDAFPGDVESDDVHAPGTEVLQVLGGEGVVGVEGVGAGVEREDFVDDVDAVEEEGAAGGVGEEMGVRVDGKGGEGEED